ncbi:MAG: prolyl oligopeptidase family serine peptidase [Bacteroidota bacterium]
MNVKLFTIRKNLLPLIAANLLVILVISSCRKECPAPAEPVVTWEYIETYDLPKLNHILNVELEEFLVGSTMKASDFQGQFATPKYPVKLYRVTYPTMVPELGIPTVASGLVAIPDNGLDSMPVVSYQHGTVMLKTACPSNPDSSLETRLMIAQFASRGYIVIGPDFIGLGVSDQPHADFVRLTTEQACIDMLNATDKVLKEQKIRRGTLFLHGWSQGGWATMTFLRRLEAMNIRVTAASTACAAADFFALMDRWINNPQPGDSPILPAIIATCLFSYEYYNQLNGLASSAIRPEFFQASKDLYCWKMDYITFLTKTTMNVRELLRPEFMSTGNTGSTPFWQVLEQAQAYRWRCQTPLRMYYGEVDVIIPLYFSTLPAAYQNQLGCNTMAISAGAIADHSAAYVYSIIHAKPWFDEFLKK